MKKQIEYLQEILANQVAIAEALQIKLPSQNQVCLKQTKPNGNPINLLPLVLRAKLTNETAFKKAFLGEKPLLFIKEGKIGFNIKKKNLKAYFLGRLFAGDFSEAIFGETIWQHGGEFFPFAEISDVFLVDSNVLQSRKNRKKKKAPKGYRLIDRYFA